MHIVYAMKPFPASFTKAIFLAGPTPRNRPGKPVVPSWRPEAIRLLEAAGYDGVVFVPETADGNWRQHYDEQVAWEDEGLNRSDCILFWVPRKLRTMPAFTTNHEHGEWFKSGKIVFAAPKKAPKTNYLRLKAVEFGAPTAETLEDGIAAAMNMVGEGALRTGGECEVPLLIWKTPSFQEWYAAQKAVGNRLDHARVEWQFRVTRKKFLFLWAMHVDVFVAKEGRNKKNEVVLARPATSSVLLYRRDGADPLATHIVLVREFRSPVANQDGFVHELPGGSSFRPGETPIQTAAEEVAQETGFAIPSSRLVPERTRQMASTILAHKGHLFSAEVTEDELAELSSRAGIAQGVEGDSERTYVEIKTLREILAGDLVDWSTLGMILSILK